VSDEPQPLLRVVRGEPTADELAALVAVVAARAAARPAEPQPVSAWTDRSRLVRRTLAHGPGTWRASGLPGQPFT
jgi:phage terminase large subunit GpA-like protein